MYVGSGDIAPLLEVSTRWIRLTALALRLLTKGEKIPGTCWIEGCLGSRIFLYNFREKKYLFFMPRMYSDWLRAGRSGDQIPLWRDFPSVQTGPGAHPASCTMGTGSFPGVKYGRGVLLTTHPLLLPWSWSSTAIPLLTLWATTGSVTGTLCLSCRESRYSSITHLISRVTTTPTEPASHHSTRNFTFAVPSKEEFKLILFVSVKYRKSGGFMFPPAL